MYGNAPKPITMEDKRKNQMVKLFPKIMSDLSELFSYKGSSFKMEKYKEGTARIELYK
jgi:hypothetical protein